MKSRSIDNRILIVGSIALAIAEHVIEYINSETDEEKKLNGYLLFASLALAGLGFILRDS